MTQSKELIRQIVEGSKLREILQHCSFDTLGTFDIDNTLVLIAEMDAEGREQHDVGSDQWFYMLLTYAKEVVGEQEALNLALEMNKHIQKVVQVKPVEEKMTPLILGRLKDVGLPLMGLSARASDLAEVTEKQLKSAEIVFDSNLRELDRTLDENNGIDLEITLKDGEPQRHVRYENGILYCDGADKGKCLNALFEHIKRQEQIQKTVRPEEKHREIKYSVVMVDDKKHNLEKMLEAANAGGYAFTGIRYSATDQHVDAYDMSKGMEKTAQFVHARKLDLPEQPSEIIARFKSTLLDNQDVPDPTQGTEQDIAGPTQKKSP